MPDSILYVFSISHFCEKAKWALDYNGIAYRTRILVPGAHTAVARKLGFRRSSLPILVAGADVLQGSSEIIDWADRHAKNSAPSLNPAQDAALATAIEKRLDDVLGVHVRRMFYSEALVDYPQMVKPIFAAGLSFTEKIKLWLMWPMVRKKMIALMDLGAAQGQESTAIVDAELRWLEGLLGKNGDYLLGNRFSRLDLTAASLLAGAVLPAEHPAQQEFVLPPRMQKIMMDWRNRPVLRWVENIYATHRHQT